MKIKTLILSFCVSAGLVALLAGCGGGTKTTTTNQAPIANAGSNQTAQLNAEITLDGSKSTDANGDTLTYAWLLSSKPANSASTLTNPTAVKPKLVVDKAGEYVVTLTVNDGKVNSTTSTVTIKVNTTPIAQAGADRSALVGETVGFDGKSSSDADADSLTYQWTLTSKPATSTIALKTANTVYAELIADVAGKYVVSLIVNDGKVSSTADTVNVEVRANQAPTVNLGSDIYREFSALNSIGISIPVSAQDPEGTPLTSQWELLSKPTQSMLSSSHIQSDAVGNGWFTPDAYGRYEVKLSASDGLLTASDTILINVSNVNHAPVAVSADKYVEVGKTVTLDASTSTDSDNDALSYQWIVKSIPSGSTAALSSLTAAKPTLTADKEGEYLFDLVVSDGKLSSPAISVKVTAQQIIKTLTYQVVDAEYSKALDKLIMVSGSPNQLHIYDTVTKTEQAVNLPLIPSSVSISPDGLFAAVGHNANVSYIDLSKAQLLKTLSVSTNVGDVVLGGNGYIYAFSKSSTWSGIYSINLENAKTLSNSLIYIGTVAKLHPSGVTMYGANNGLSPSDIERYDIQTGTANKLYDSPYHGDYEMCGNLWLSEDGKRIFTACGNVFRASDAKEQDMTYNGSLVDLPHVKALDHSALIGKVAAIPAYAYYWSQSKDIDAQIKLYDYEFLAPSETLLLPAFIVNNKSYLAHGRFVFFNKASDSIIVILQADVESGMLNDFGVITLPQSKK